MIRIPIGLTAVRLGSFLVAVACSAHPSFAQAPPGATMALTGARVIDGTGSAPLDRATIVVANGRIASVGPDGQVTIPAGATRVDMTGKTIVPGLINAHGHLSADNSARPIPEKLTGQLRVYADYGVTAVVVLGSEPDDLGDTVKLRDAQENGVLDRARVYVAGPSLREAKTVEEARAVVDRYAEARVDIIKFHITGGPNDMTPSVYRALIEHAHRRGLRAAAHVYYLKDARGLLDAGVDVIAHSVRDQDVDEGLIAGMKQRNVGYIPTFTRDLAQFVYESTPAFFRDPFFTRHIDAYDRQVKMLSDPTLQEKTRNNKGAQNTKVAIEQASRNLKKLSDAGVAIAMGTDSGANLGQWQGYFEHVELEYMVKAGLTPMQTLVAATGGAARVMKLDGQLGTIQPGKRADLLVLNANPLADIKNTRQIHSVWIGGRRLAAPGTN